MRMSEPAQPGIQLLTIEGADFTAVFADSIPRFKNLHLSAAAGTLYPEARPYMRILHQQNG